MKAERDRERTNLPPYCSFLEDHRQLGEGGWREAVISGGDHLQRVLQEYGELEFECLLEELDSPDIEGCTECFKTAGERLYRVYVRPKGG